MFSFMIIENIGFLFRFTIFCINKPKKGIKMKQTTNKLVYLAVFSFAGSSSGICLKLFPKSMLEMNLASLKSVLHEASSSS